MGSDLSTLTALFSVARNYIFGFGFAVALLIGFAFCNVIRIPGLLTVVVWTCIAGVFFFLLFGLGLGLLAFLLWMRHGRL